MNVLVTGGAGYIGSHTCIELIAAGHEVIVVDNFCNSDPESLKRVEEISGKSVGFYEVDICDKEALSAVFASNKVDAVIHFAGLKAVGESVEQPGRYYHNNVTGTLVLCDVMAQYGVYNIVFSSSATVYGNPASVPIDEQFPLSATNPYGRSKLMIEEILRDFNVSDSRWNTVLLRYFNPAGAHHSGLIGEDPNGIPNNLMPYITQVAVGKLKQLSVYGNDYDTVDGSGVRDYIHVVDLALGHLKALDKLAENPGTVAYNLGTGRGYSVLEVVSAFERASSKNVPYVFVDRRPGDVASCYADTSYALQELGWKALKGIDEMTRDSWNWQNKNPNGFASDGG
ncbi:MAG: UDP-glucose 4-epimerase [Oceanicoccus sp.]|jgi:UDP-glucose 4-epimerase